MFQTTAPGLAMAFMLLSSVSAVAILGWFTTCWGALRDLHAVGRWRSTLAGMGALVAAAAFVRVLDYVLIGMFGTFTPPLR